MMNRRKKRQGEGEKDRGKIRENKEGGREGGMGGEVEGGRCTRDNNSRQHDGRWEVRRGPIPRPVHHRPPLPPSLHHTTDTASHKFRHASRLSHSLKKYSSANMVHDKEQVKKRVLK